MDHLDHVREVLMHEPRGHHGVYGCIITPPAKETSDFSVLFLHNQGWSTMCGHGIIAVITMGIETGRNTFIIDSPAGEVTVFAEVDGNRVKSVSFENVPSFVLKKDIKIEVDGKEFVADVSFGGTFYVMVESQDIGLSVSKKDLPQLQEWGTKIKAYVEENWDIVHPLEKGLKGIYGVIFSDKPKSNKADLRNVTIFAAEQVDRSPCGTGTCAKLASLYEHGELEYSGSFVHESITDGHFIGKVIGEEKIANYSGVAPLVQGYSYITGFHQFVNDPEDTLPRGFLLEEI